MRPLAWLMAGGLALTLLVPGQVYVGAAEGPAVGAVAAVEAPGAAPGVVVPLDATAPAAGAPPVPALPAATAAAPASLPEPAGGLAPVVDPGQVYTYDLLTRDLAALQARQPDLVRLRSIGQSAFGRDLWAVGLGTGPATVLVNGAHHGSEWLTANLVAAMADRYALAATADHEVATLLRAATIWFVPMVNPDGVSLSQLGLESAPEAARAGVRAMNGGSEDFRGWKANGQGIDLNRQYPADWEHIVASPPGPAFSHFKGEAPLAAPEAKALFDFTLEVQPDAVAAYHSAGRVIYWHFHTAREHFDRDLALAEDLAELTGYDLMPVEESPSGGGYKDWFVETLGRPGFTIEIGRYTDGGPLPLSAFAEEWERNRDVGIALARAAVHLRQSVP